MKIKEHLHYLHVLATAPTAVYPVLVKSASADLLAAINEIFFNISQLSFPINNEEACRNLEDCAELVEELATLKSIQLQRTLVENRQLAQQGISVALEYLAEK